MTPRGAGTTASAAAREDQLRAQRRRTRVWAGPGLCPDSERRRCARIFRMTAGSWRVAISRSRPRSAGTPGTSMADHWRRRGCERGREPAVRDHARARGRARPAGHGKSASSFPAAAPSPQAAPGTPAARTPVPASRRARPSSARARRGPTTTLFFTAGPSGESHGLFGQGGKPCRENQIRAQAGTFCPTPVRCG
jgi:hypothetical protein